MNYRALLSFDAHIVSSPCLVLSARCVSYILPSSLVSRLYRVGSVHICAGIPLAAYCSNACFRIGQPFRRAKIIRAFVGPLPNFAVGPAVLLVEQMNDGGGEGGVLEAAAGGFGGQPGEGGDYSGAGGYRAGRVTADFACGMERIAANELVSPLSSAVVGLQSTFGRTEVRVGRVAIEIAEAETERKEKKSHDFAFDEKADGIVLPPEF